MVDSVWRATKIPRLWFTLHDSLPCAAPEVDGRAERRRTESAYTSALRRCSYA